MSDWLPHIAFGSAVLAVVCYGQAAKLWVWIETGWPGFNERIRHFID